MQKQPPAQRSEDERDALQLAAELSERARAEGETARLLADHIAAMGAAHEPLIVKPTGSSAEARPAGSMQVGCRSCGVEQTVSLADPDAGTAEAKAFFARHADCLTFVDLDTIRHAL